MDGQSMLADFNIPEYRETQFLDTISNSIVASVEAAGADRSFLKRKATKSGKSSSSGYTAVYLSTFTVFRLHLRGTINYISVPSVFHDLISADVPIRKIKSEPKYIRIIVDELHPVESYTDLLITIMRKSVERFPKEWDCCSRYEVCSDAQKCVHPDPCFALGCGYRKVLNSGKIYYGAKRNVK